MRYSKFNHVPKNEPLRNDLLSIHLILQTCNLIYYFLANLLYRDFIFEDKWLAINLISHQNIKN